MQINELARITGINAETIRSYRNKGLLHPTRMDNGYYDYGTGDYVSLLYIRKLRSFSLSTSSIEQITGTSSMEEQLEVFNKETRILKDQISDLQSQLRFLEFERRHIKESQGIMKNHVSKLQSIDDKIDFYELSDDVQTLPSSAESKLYRMTTPSLFISKEILNGPCTDKMIPLKTGIGTYRYILNQNHFEIPDNAVVVPNGICLSMIVRLTTLNELNLLQLKPMMDYAKQLKKPFISDTTAYLVRMQLEDKKPVYDFRIRACIEANQKQDHGAR
jgi:DNA-binding transcriptional MerR regulator